MQEIVRKMNYMNQTFWQHELEKYGKMHQIKLGYKKVHLQASKKAHPTRPS